MATTRRASPEVLRVVLAGMPRILVQILRDLVGRQADMAIVGEVQTLEELPAAIGSLHPQAVILGASGRDLVVPVGTLRQRNPALTFLCLSPCDDRAVVCSPHATPRPVELSAATVLGALRAHHGAARGREALA